jgi:hypothetical protein
MGTGLGRSTDIAALHRAERDYFGVPETEIELPDWI